MLAYVYFYDQRGGGVETSIKADKQGLGLTNRNKKRLDAQQMVMLLTALAHNVILWVPPWLEPKLPKLARYGMVRMVRDVFHVSGFVVLNPWRHVVQIVLNHAAPWAASLAGALANLLALQRVGVNLDEN